MSNAAPPAWVLALDLDSGSWRCLVGLWMFAAYGVTGVTVVWPSRKTLARTTGQKTATVARQLQKLATAGLIRRLDGTRIELAWRAPDDHSTGPTTLVVDDHSPPPDDSSAPPDDHSHRPPTTTVTPKLQGTSNLPSSEVEDATPHDSATAAGLPAKQAPRHYPESSPDENTTAHNHTAGRATREPGRATDRADGGRGLRADTPTTRGGVEGSGRARGDMLGDQQDRTDARGSRGRADGDGPGAILTEAHPEHAQASLSFQDRIKRASASAYSSLLSSGRTLGAVDANTLSRDWSWCGQLRKAQLDLDATDDHVITMCETWERTSRDDKPPMGQVWRYDQREWLKSAMGIKPRGKALAPGQQTPAEIAEFIKRSSMGARP